MDIVLTIKLTEGKQVFVEGPINDIVLCYGLMEAAKDIIRKFNEKPVNSSPLTLPKIKLNGTH